LPVAPPGVVVSPIAAEIPKPVARKFQRLVSAAGSVIVLLSGIANSASNRSLLSAAGILIDGAVTLVEDAFAWPPLASIGLLVLTPE
jgi:hypothetical protein